MSIDKATLKFQLEKEYQNKSLTEIDKEIKACRIVRSLYNEWVMFVFSLLPFTVVSILSFLSTGSLIISAIILLAHYPFYIFFVKNFIFSFRESEYNKLSNAIDILGQIRKEKE
jgi:hypothetical protein